MKSEIKFRGIPLFGKEFVYGSLIIDTNEKGEKVYIIRRIESGKVSNFEVKEETVGQYTGLKDKNDVEIYEGDIVRDGSRLWKIEISPIYGIFFILSKGGHTRCYGDFASYLVDDFQVIGNIYEQSYLLDNNS